jgi:glucose-1-phosphate adenylyltransferase
VPEGAQIGYDAELDRSRGFTVTEGGLTVVPKGMKIAGKTEDA